MTATVAAPTRDEGMPPTPPPGPPPASPRRAAAPGRPPRIVERVRLLAASLGLVLLAFLQQPGMLSPDTKLDLVVDPWGMLGRALHLWEPLGFLGQVQNQAYGYLLPMGPFFGLGHSLSVPAWVVQRAWWSLLLVTAFLGAAALMRRLGIGTPWTRLLGALAYALAPRMMTTLGPISVEALPMALAPWVLVPLVTGAHDATRSPRRAALLSAVAVLLVGGVNAVASMTVLVLPALYLLTRAPGPRRRRLMAWWAAGVAMAVAWWLLPLLLLGRYSPPFLDYIEGAAATTLPTNLAETLRGTDHWIAYVVGDTGPTWSAGWQLVTVPIVIVYTVAVAAFGLAGLAHRRIPERGWLVTGAAVGLLLVTLGHEGPATGPLAASLNGLLDGGLAPLRNVHKFDPVLRLVLAIGLAHALAVVARVSARRPGWGAVAPMVAALAALGIVGSAFPALTGQTVPSGSFRELPGYWVEASDWVAAHQGTGRSLIAPGAPFARFTWGGPRDEPFQALGDVSWAVRDSIPLAPAGTIRTLDAIQQRMAAGRAIPGLPEQLAAMGIRFLVLRNDLDTAGGRAVLPSVVHESLRGVQGLRRVATFGPFVGGQLDDTTVVDEGLSVPYPAVEVYEVVGYDGPVSLTPLSQVPRVAGGPESVLAARDAGVVGAGPVLLDGERLAGATGPLVATEGTARRELNPGRVDDNVSARLARDDPTVLGRRVLDYRAFPDDRALSAATWAGPVRARASSQASDADTPGGSVPVHQAFSGVDADPATAWWSSPRDGAVGQWLELDLGTAVPVAGTRLVVDTTTPVSHVTRVRVTTDSGSVDRPVAADGVVDLSGVAGTSATVRATALAVSDGGRGTVFGVRDLTVPGIVVQRTLEAPVPSGVPAVTVVTAAPDERPDCVHLVDATPCTDLLARPGEDGVSLDRVVDLGGPGERSIVVGALPRSGPWLDALIAAQDRALGTPMTATASSQRVAAPEAGPRAAIDGDARTAWVAAPGDKDPVLAIDLGERREVRGIRLQERLGLNASRPLSAVVQGDDGQQRRGRFDARGELWFDPLTTTRLVIRFPAVQPVLSVDPTDAGGSTAPVGVSELQVLGAADLAPDAAAVRTVTIPCGQGPVVRVGDTLLQTRGSAALADLVQRLPVGLTTCGGPVAVAPGAVRLTVLGAGRWTPQVAVVRAPGARGEVVAPVAAAGSAEVAVRDWGTVARGVALPARPEPALLVVHENANSGWVATLDGRTLDPTRAEGWQQAWIVPAGAAGTVVLTYAPDTTYRVGLLAGLLAALLLLVLAAWRPRRDTRPAATGPRSVRRELALAAGVAVLVLLGGWWGLTAAVGVAALSWLLPPRGRDAAWPLLAGATYAAAGLLLALHPWFDPGGYAGGTLPVQVLCLVAVAFVVVPWLPPRRVAARPTSAVSAADAGAPTEGPAAPPPGT